MTRETRVRELLDTVLEREHYVHLHQTSGTTGPPLRVLEVGPFGYPCPAGGVHVDEQEFVCEVLDEAVRNTRGAGDYRLVGRVTDLRGRRC